MTRTNYVLSLIFSWVVNWYFFQNVSNCFKVRKKWYKRYHLYNIYGHFQIRYILFLSQNPQKNLDFFFGYLYDQFDAEINFKEHDIIINRLHSENFFRNLIKSIRNQIVFNNFRLIWNQKDVHLVPNFWLIGS